MLSIADDVATEDGADVETAKLSLENPSEVIDVDEATVEETSRVIFSLVGSTANCGSTLNISRPLIQWISSGSDTDGIPVTWKKSISSPTISTQKRRFQSMSLTNVFGIRLVAVRILIDHQQLMHSRLEICRLEQWGLVLSGRIVSVEILHSAVIDDNGVVSMTTISSILLLLVG